MRLEKKFLEITLNLIKQMKDDAEASVSIEVAMSLVDTIEALQQENEQLRAQVARMREALIECVNALELCTHDELCKIAVSPYDMIQDAKEALAEIDKAIGGKEDV